MEKSILIKETKRKVGMYKDRTWYNGRVIFLTMLSRENLLSLIKDYIGKGKEFNYTEILKIDDIRVNYARQRLQNAKIKIRQESSNSIDNTVKHNLRGVDPANSANRPMALLGPLMGTNEAIDSTNKKVLIIGPRSENELFLYMSHGFKKENITCIDLISYSDTIEMGDMHDLKYQDNTFDIVVCGWVLAYSKNQPLAAYEMARVTKPNGLIAIGSDVNRKTKSEKEHYAKAVMEERGYELRSEGLPDSEKLKQLFEKYTNKVIFDNYTDGTGRWNNIIIKVK